MELEKLVTLAPGKNATVEFDFQSPVVTRLDIRVPDEAIVRICGKEMKLRNGPLRTFETTSLDLGQSWKDYEVEVEFEADGEKKLVKRKLDIEAGKSHQLSFMPTTLDASRIAAR